MTTAHSLPKVVDPEMKKPVTWTVEYRLQVPVDGKYRLTYLGQTTSR